MKTKEKPFNQKCASKLLSASAHIYTVCGMNHAPLRLHLHAAAPLLLAAQSLYGGQAAVALQWASITALPAAGPLSHSCPPPPPTAPLGAAGRSATPQQTASAAAICLQLRSCRVSSEEEIKKINPAVILIRSKLKRACNIAGQ